MSFILKGILESLVSPLENTILQLNRNGRFPKPANHGARPCSSVMRRLKPKTPLDMEDWNSVVK
jgi:hypothetical protein